MSITQQPISWIVISFSSFKMKHLLTGQYLHKIFILFIHAWIVQLVAHWLGTPEVVGLNTSKGESLFLTLIWINCIDLLSRVSTHLVLWHKVDMLHQDPEQKSVNEPLFCFFVFYGQHLKLKKSKTLYAAKKEVRKHSSNLTYSVSVSV